MFIFLAYTKLREWATTRGEITIAPLAMLAWLGSVREGVFLVIDTLLAPKLKNVPKGVTFIPDVGRQLRCSASTR